MLKMEIDKLITFRAQGFASNSSLNRAL